MTENIFSTSRQEINSWKVKKKYTEVGYKKKTQKTYITERSLEFLLIS